METRLDDRDNGDYFTQLDEARRAATSLRTVLNVIRRSVAGRGTIESMNRLEEQALIDDLRRRDDHLVRAASLSCTVEHYRAAARKVGRKHGWRIRTFLVDGGAGIIVVWVDRGQTELEKRAAMITISTGRDYDEALKELRRQNLRPVEDA